MGGPMTQLSVKLHKVQNLILDRLQQTFRGTFYSKVFFGPNCISEAVATKPGLNFFEVFKKHGLEINIGLSQKFNVHHVQAFYCYVVPIENGFGLSCEFKNQVLTFTAQDFKTVLGLDNTGYEFTRATMDSDYQ